MANHAHVSLGKAQKPGEIGAGPLVIESHDDYGAFALAQILEAASEPFLVERRRGRLDRRLSVGFELIEQAFSSLRVAAHVEHGHTAGSQHEGCELFGFAQAAGSQSFERRDQDLLGQIVGGLFVAQMTQAIETDTGRHAAAKLGFGYAAGRGSDLPRQFGVVHFEVHQRIFYV